MTLSRRKFSGEFKLRAVRQVEAGASVAAVARRYEIHPTLLSKVAATAAPRSRTSLSARPTAA